MEILSYVLSGELSHKDNQGNVGVIRPGDVQRMTAGTGIMHSEFNASEKEPVHFLQIWILPDKRGAKPRYEDRSFPAEGRHNRLQLLASPDEAQGSLSIDQDVRVYTAVLEAGSEVSLDLAPGRAAWVQVARGSVIVGPGLESGQNGVRSQRLEAGDGAAVEKIRRLMIQAETGAEALVFDLA